MELENKSKDYLLGYIAALKDVFFIAPDKFDVDCCGDCGDELELVRPGKYQCNNPKCPSNV